MQDSSHDQLDPSGTVAVLLEGGPLDLPRSLSIARDIVRGCRIKIPHRNGYEHFERDDADVAAASRQVPFRWTMRTTIAE